ncbi:hypothetical protein [Candidatus Neoehrlichia procyonis]|uniref:Uncharacterized protein n=1 Tax=Candidatus Neoehrlichia procyonis str. RAC413 TaxID=1359163 RepID=A0A0F3NNL6_9RICK|nr:hypothetical protein [Candidatus Neoehrlichia lotoris]KJV69640.1 hypothetical protein NLO413_1040 [Candidatus Neoehrlichia lotoris str. RAC413]
MTKYTPNPNYYNKFISSITIDSLINEATSRQDVLCGNTAMQDYHRKNLCLNGIMIPKTEEHNLSIKENIETYINNLIRTCGILPDLQDICKMYNIDQKDFLEKCPRRYLMYVEYKKLFNKTIKLSPHIKLINELITNCNQGGLLIGSITAKCIHMLFPYVNTIIKPDNSTDIHIKARKDTLKTNFTLTHNQHKPSPISHNILADDAPKIKRKQYNNASAIKEQDHNSTTSNKQKSYNPLSTSDTLKVREELLLDIVHNETVFSQVNISLEYSMSLQDNNILYHNTYFTITIPNKLSQLITHIKEDNLHNNSNNLPQLLKIHRSSSDTKLVYHIGQAKISSQFQNLLSQIPKDINAFSFPITINNVQVSPDEVMADTKLQHHQDLQYFK